MKNHDRHLLQVESSWRLAYCPPLLPLPEDVSPHLFHHLALPMILPPTVRYLRSILGTPQPIHPFPEHVCRRHAELLAGPSQNGTCSGGGIGRKSRAGRSAVNYFRFGRTRVCITPVSLHRVEEWVLSGHHRCSSRIMVPPRAERGRGVVSVSRSGPGKVLAKPTTGR